MLSYGLEFQPVKHAASAKRIGLPATGVKPGLRHGSLYVGEVTREGRIEFVIIAGDLVTLGDIDERIALIEDAEIRIRGEGVVHEAPVIAVDNHDSWHFQMRIGVAGDEVLHVGRKTLDLAWVDENVEFRIEAPQETSALDELAGEDAEAFDGARRDIGADR